MNAASAIELCGLTKDFLVGVRGVRLRAVDDISLRIRCGEIFGLLGPNGSGKSTTLKIVLGFVSPTRGTATIFGMPSGSREAQRRIGYLPESPDFYRYLTGEELVRFYGGLSGLHGQRLRSRTAEVIELVGLSSAAHRRIGVYSKGMLQRIGLAQALIDDPDLLILDEPTAGVDPFAAAEISELLMRLKACGKTIVLSSHHLEQVEQLCDRVAILDHGRLLVSDQVSVLTGRKQIGGTSVRIDELGPEDRLDIVDWARARGLATSTPSEPRASLDEVFRTRVCEARLAGEKR